MPRAVKSYARPTVILCLVCGGDVAVAPVGTIPEGHARCMLVRRDLHRLQGDIDLSVEGRNSAELKGLADYLAAELQQIRNSFVNTYANPARRKARPG